MKNKIKALLWAKAHIIASLVLAFLIGFAVASVFGGYQYSQNQSLQEQYQQVKAEKSKLVQEKAALTVQTAVLESSNEGLRKGLQEQEARLQENERTLDFYYQLMNPEKKREGLVLNSYKVIADDERAYRINFIFVQFIKQRKVLSAKLAISLKGTKNGEIIELNLQDILSVVPDNWDKLRFSYFQSLDYAVILPEGFKPESIEIVAKISKKPKENWQLSLPWMVEDL